MNSKITDKQIKHLFSYKYIQNIFPIKIENSILIKNLCNHLSLITSNQVIYLLLIYSLDYWHAYLAC